MAPHPTPHPCPFWAFPLFPLVIPYLSSPSYPSCFLPPPTPLPLLWHSSPKLPMAPLLPPPASVPPFLFYPFLFCYPPCSPPVPRGPPVGFGEVWGCKPKLRYSFCVFFKNRKVFLVDLDVKNLVFQVGEPTSKTNSS